MMSAFFSKKKIDLGVASSYSFEKELVALQNDARMRALCKPSLYPFLKELYNYEEANNSPFELLLTESRNVLFSFFDEILGDELHLPKGQIAQKIFLQICSQDISIAMLQQLLRIRLLDHIDAARLEDLPVVYTRKMATIIKFTSEYFTQLQREDWLLGLDLLCIILPKQVEKDTAKYLSTFIKDIVPCFVQTFAEDLAKAVLYQHLSKILTWYLVWEAHQKQSLGDIKLVEEYYQTPFETIIQYAPNYLLWNNGLSYAKNEKFYEFNSPGFFHLATGGSIRNAPDYRPYTRRMAKVFVNLPYNFQAMGMDMYLYLYTQSLSRGAQLNYLLQNYIRHYSGSAQLKKELEKWNPVIQKLNTDDFENLEAEDARSLVGYLAHGLRDIKKFSIRKKTVAQLLGDTRDYEGRIRANAQRRARILYNRKKKCTNWDPHPTIDRLEYRWRDTSYLIQELCNADDLNNEGAAMGHCVGSYVHQCVSGATSIWSLRALRDGRWKSYVTIEIRNRSIVQAAGRFNSRPEMEYAEVMRIWARRENLIL